MIKNAVKALQGNEIHVDIFGHQNSEIKGNEIADQLAKEATLEAETLNVEVQTVSVQENKHARKQY